MLETDMLLNIFLSLPVILFSGQVKKKGGGGEADPISVYLKYK